MTLSFDPHEIILILLWRTTWQAAVLTLIAYALVILTRRWIAAKWRVLVLTLPLLRLVLLVVPASSLSLFNFIAPVNNGASPTTATSLVPANQLTAIALPIDNAEGAAASDLAVELIPHTTGDQLRDAGSAALLKAEPLEPLSIGNYVVGIWLTGCAFMLLRWMSSRIALRRLLASSDPFVNDELASWMRADTSKRFVCCMVNDANIGPSSCGLLRPTILLPRQLIEEISTNELRTIIRHELTHIRRFDGLLLALSRLATTIHWFNPLAYFIARRLRQQIEFAVDAETVSSFDDHERQSYGSLLLQLTRRPATNLGLAQMADRGSNIRARIEAITNPCRTTRLRSVLALGMVSLLLLTGLSDRAETQDPNSGQVADATTKTPENHAYFVTGVVREQGTEKPVEGAKIQFLDSSAQDPQQRLRIGVSDAQGRYRIAVPMGSIRLWFPELKPGYWMGAKQSMVEIVTSPASPVAEHNLVVRKAPVWQVQVDGDRTPPDSPSSTNRIIFAMEEPDAKNRAAMLNNENVTWDETPSQAFSYCDSNGRGELTQVGTSGGLVITIVNVQTELVVEPGFDNANVVSAERLPDSEETTEMRDASGKVATVGRASVTLDGGVPLLTFRTQSVKPIAVQKLSGQIVDANGAPLGGARIGIAAGQKGKGNSVWELSTKSAEDGRFRLDVPIQAYASNMELQFSAIVTKDGFAGTDTPYAECTEDYKPIDLGTIKLSAGYSVPVRVVDALGKPSAGAVIEPGNDYSLRRKAERSGPDGRAVIRDLPSGLVRVSVRHGGNTTSTKLVVSEDATENREMILRLGEAASPPATGGARAKPVAIGTLAPEWSLRGWSDGESRKLAGYRGKVVVIDFWGIWCGPCISIIPALQQLADEYEPRDVVFVGVHTADGSIEQICKLQKLRNWTTVSGLDVGTSIADGETCRSYGVSGFPTLVVVDTEGKIAYRSDLAPENREQFMNEMGELAESLGMPWPPKEDAPREEMEAMMNKLMKATIGREIDRVLQ